eukprot:TRINITY_DN68099_c2_g2_i2.p1 TRINITY_DN68099_c2_g2~~TRINITY_DN68099_c2_g2_i2.p1  ORF type:complete len:202 (-),score=2.30 TRINITY_DN68099_c2_g2_i2:1287-1892(-)
MPKVSSSPTWRKNKPTRPNVMWGCDLRLPGTGISSSPSYEEDDSHDGNNDWASHILPYLWIGDAAAAANATKLQQHNISHVLNVSREPNSSLGSGVETLQIPICDKIAEPISESFPAVIDFIRKAKESGGSVLVHCKGGVSRSPTVVMAYLMNQYGMSYKKTMDFVMNKRPRVYPNLGFDLALMQYSEQMQQKWASPATQR